ncbi:MAG: glycosyltransferase [Maritimibacter sp.]|nr:glycosyltransferase [Maritimibacter sp.]
MLTTLLSLAAAIPLGAHLGSAGLAIGRRHRDSDPQAKPFRPFLSLIRPVKGLDPYDRETLASSFRQDYPEYEVIFCAASADDPACAAVRSLIAAHPRVPAQLLIGEAPISANPKLNNLAKGVAAARSDWLVMTDANLMLAPGYLAGLADAWAPGVGLVSAPALGDRAGNFWGAVECAFLNTSQARWQLAADALGIGFAQGKTLFWNRKVLETGGGLAALGGNMAEDVASTKLVRAQGLKVRLPARLSFQPVGRRRFADVWQRQLRWSRVRRDGFVALFAAEIAQGPALGLLSLAALGLAGLAPLGLAVAYLALWYGAEIAVAAHLGLRLHARDLFAMLVRDALQPALWIATFARRGFEWRGNEMRSAAS